MTNAEVLGIILMWLVVMRTSDPKRSRAFNLTVEVAAFVSGLFFLWSYEILGWFHKVPTFEVIGWSV